MVRSTYSSFPLSKFCRLISATSWKFHGETIMGMLGIDPGAAGWEAQILPLLYAAPLEAHLYSWSESCHAARGKTGLMSSEYHKIGLCRWTLAKNCSNRSFRELRQELLPGLVLMVMETEKLLPRPDLPTNRRSLNLATWFNKVTRTCKN